MCNNVLRQIVIVCIHDKLQNEIENAYNKMKNNIIKGT